MSNANTFAKPSLEWRIVHHPENPLGPHRTHGFYIFDFRRNEMHCIDFDREIFKALDGGTATQAELAAFIDGILSELAPDMPVPQALSTHLGAGISLYVRNTSTYQLWQENSTQDERMHCLLHVYSGSDDEFFLRPAVTSYDEGLHIPHDVLVELSTSIVQTDVKRKPEWFGIVA